MKFFVYIADAKIDRSLAELTCEERAALADELRVDAAMLEQAEGRRADPDEVRFARAEALGLRLAQTQASASFGASAPFVADCLALHWGRLRVMRGAELVRHETESPVAFAFASEPSELIMVGSASQLLAQSPKATVAATDDAPGRDGMQLLDVATDLDALDQRSLDYVFEGAPLQGESAAWAARLARARADLRALPAERLEFLAKPIATVDAANARIVLATPIYVAMVV